MNKQRFHYLVEKYKLHNMTWSEYQEFVAMLSEPGSEKDLDQLLSRYWQETELKENPLQKNPIQPAKKNKRFLHPFWAIAASLLVMVGLFFFMWGTPEILGNRELVYKTGFGERLEIDLDDGSHITLNANSELRWAEGWEDKRNRLVTLEGEAFFQVKKQHGIPFTVNTNDVAVEVLGTSFNVDSREEKTEVYLDEGKVNLKLKEEQTTISNDVEKEIVMKPGDQIRYSAKEKIVEKSEGQNMISAASWKKNVLNFKNMQFSEVLEMLRDIYGQSFECTNRALLSKPMVIGVPYSDWEAVRQALELSLNIEFQKTANRRYVIKRMKK